MSRRRSCSKARFVVGAVAVGLDHEPLFPPEEIRLIAMERFVDLGVG
jgi:hypothetical protein